MGVAHLNIVFVTKELAIQWTVELMELYSALQQMLVILNVIPWKDAVLQLRHQPPPPPPPLQLVLPPQQLLPSPPLRLKLGLIVMESVPKWEMAFLRENVAFLTSVTAKVMETLTWSALKKELSGVLRRVTVSLAVRTTVGVRVVKQQVQLRQLLNRGQPRKMIRTVRGCVRYLPH